MKSFVKQEENNRRRSRSRFLCHALDACADSNRRRWTASAATHHYLIFSIKQIKPTCVRQLKGARGHERRSHRAHRARRRPAPRARPAQQAHGRDRAAGAAAGFSALSTAAVPFTAGSNTQILAKALPPATSCSHGSGDRRSLIDGGNPALPGHLRDQRHWQHGSYAASFSASTTSRAIPRLHAAARGGQ